jgi:hypothetical protein
VVAPNRGRVAAHPRGQAAPAAPFPLIRDLLMRPPLFQPDENEEQNH